MVKFRLKKKVIFDNTFANLRKSFGEKSLEILN